MLAPLSHREIEAWARLSKNEPLHPWEVEALISLDEAMFVEREPGNEDKGTLPQQVPNHVKHAWPKRKD